MLSTRLVSGWLRWNDLIPNSVNTNLSSSFLKAEISLGEPRPHLVNLERLKTVTATFLLEGSMSAEKAEYTRSSG